MSKEKHAGSRSKNFKSVSEMKAEIDKYFHRCDSNIRDSRSFQYTTEWLATILEIDRKTINN